MRMIANITSYFLPHTYLASHRHFSEDRVLRSPMPCTSITVSSGLAQNLTRGASPPSMPMPLFVYI
jgi:hypothetical protein